MFFQKLNLSLAILFASASLIFCEASLANTLGFKGGVPIGGACTSDTDCEGYPESMFCDPAFDACYCKDDHELVGDGPYTCEKIRQQIGEPCVVKSQCTKGEPGELSDCLPSFGDPNKKVCNCSEGATHQPGQHKCYPILSLIGEACAVSAQCEVNMSEWAECSTGHRCACKSGSVESNERDKCLPIRNELGLICLITEQCTLGEPGRFSDCMNPFEEGENDPVSKICNCTAEAINEPGQHECHERRDEIGQECEVNAQCKINLGDLSECRSSNNSCSCIEDKAVSNQDESFCLAIVDGLEEECQESQQCKEGIPGKLSDCMPSNLDPEKMICNCTDEAINQPEEDVCLLRAAVVGDPCLKEAQCQANLGDLSTCDLSAASPGGDGYCKCKPGAIQRENGTHCLPIRNELEEECSESRQCQQGIPGKFSICLEGQCGCSPEATNEPGDHVCLERADLVGGTCSTNAQCKANLGELSECLRGQNCICTPNYAVASRDNKHCLPVINAIGGVCEESQQCTHGEPGDNSECMESSLIPGTTVCNCSSGSIHQPGMHKCHKVADKIGDDCEIEEQCRVNLGDLAECTTENVCQCNIDSIPIPGDTKCLGIINQIGDPCSDSIQCTTGVPGEHSECSRNEEFPYDDVCNCKPEAVKHPNRHECMKKAVQIGDPCDGLDLQCTINIGNMSTCTNEGTCICMEGWVPNKDGTPNTKCIPGGILIGQPCFDEGQCVGNPGYSSTCSSAGVCGCLPQFTESMNLDDCLEVRHLLGDDCTEPQQCQQGSPGRFSDCLFQEDKGTCGCAADAINEANRHVCYKKALLVGDPCQVGVQCVANLGNSQCLGGYCECLRDSAASESREKCLLIKYLGDPCVDKNQCSHIPNANCLLADDDDDDEDNKTCQCDEDFFKHPTKPNTCIQMATCIGDTCEDDPIQCDNLEGASCRDDTCQCSLEDDVVSEDGKTCLKISGDLHDSCKETVQCQTPNSVCGPSGIQNQTECICDPNGFTESMDTAGTCIPIIGQIGDPCTESTQCTAGVPGEWSECRPSEENPTDQVCACKPEAVQHPNTQECLKKAVVVGDQCNVDLQCTINIGNMTSCSDESTCECMSGSVPNLEVSPGTMCVPAGIRIRQPCFDMAQCVGNPGTTSTCSNGMCGCLNTFIETTNNDDCLPIRYYLGANCTEPQQCKAGTPGYFSDCIIQEDHGTCTCIADATPEDGGHTCYQKASYVGNPCQVDVQCTSNLEESVCLKGYCECKINSTATESKDKCLQIKYLSQPCVDKVQCSHIPNANCVPTADGANLTTCQCDNGFMVHPDIQNACIKRATTIGEACEAHPNQCDSLVGATCTNSTCMCRPSQEVESGDRKTCLKAVYDLHEGCVEEVQCKIQNSVCKPISGGNQTACICNPNGFVESVDTSGKCFPARDQIGLSCEDSAQCSNISSNVDCISGACGCTPPYDDYENVCYTPSKLGGSCSVHQQCYLGANELSICNATSHTCTCVETAYQVEDSCWAVKVVGSDCKNHADCTMTIIGPVYCSQLTSKCMCEAGYEEDTGGFRCSAGYSINVKSFDVTTYILFLTMTLLYFK